MWTYDLMGHLMLALATFIALATMTYTVKTNLYELHLMDERVFNNKQICLAKSTSTIWFT